MEPIQVTTPKHRSVLTTKLCQSKASTAIKSIGLVLDSKMALPIKVYSGITDNMHVATIEEENMGLDGLLTSRKRRLDHLTLDEKLKRKKLKNRVAAQTSRDKKKARMDELEVEVNQLQAENRILTQQNLALRMEKEKLAAENQALQRELSDRRTVVSVTQPASVGCRPLVGPAVSITHPLPQGRDLQPALGLCTEKTLSRIWTFCLLSQISFLTTEKQINASTSLKSLQRVCFEKLMKTDKTLLHKMARFLMDVRMSRVPAEWWGHQQKTWNPIENQITIQA